MPEKQEVACERPAAGAVNAEQPEEETRSPEAVQPKGGPMIRVGQKAPDFSAPAYIDGGFGSVQLSEYLGKWVVLCFYPGDFTFV